MIQFESRDDNNLLLLNNKNNFELNKNGHYVIHVNAYQKMDMSTKDDLKGNLIDRVKENNLEHSDEYSNGMDDMNYYENGHHFEDDYDFSRVARSLDFNNSNNESDDEDDDINFDYGYGFDYEKVIKDRLKVVNQELNNDQEPPKRKSITVSFNNSVTAIGIPNDQDTEIDLEESLVKSQEKQQKPQSQDSKQTETNKSNATKKKTSFSIPENVSKIPLNDTVQKDDPDSFTNKLRDAILRYDEEQQRLLEQQHQQQQQQQQQQIQQQPNNSFQFSIQPTKDTKNSIELSTPTKTRENSERDSLKNISNQNTNETNKSKYNSKVVNIVSNLDDSPAPNKNDNRNNKENLTNKNSELNKKSSTNSSSGTPSPTLFMPHSQSSPEPLTDKKLENSTNKNTTPFNYDSNDSFITNEFGNKETKENSETKDQLKHEKSNDTSNDNSNDSNKAYNKMVIEKDGKFLFMSAEEFTAYQKKLALEEKKAKSSLNKNNNKQNTKSSKMIPQPPSRPRTSVESSQRSSTYRNKLFINANQKSDDTNSGSGKKQEKNDGIRRVSRSADYTTKRNDRNQNFSPVNYRTPEYGQFYKSPYKLTIKVHKPVETAEEKKKREQMEEEKKRENQAAFEKWLEFKNKQRIEEQKKKTEMEKSHSNEFSSTSSEKKQSHDIWLENKLKQIQKEKDYQRKLEQLALMDRRTITPEERTKAYKEWLKRKLQDQKEAVRKEKLDQKKWVNRCKKSRKHQRLSQALEMAQAYGYNTYYLSGFN